MIALLVTGVKAGWFGQMGTSLRSITWSALNQLTRVTKDALTHPKVGAFFDEALSKFSETVAQGHVNVVAGPDRSRALLIALV